MYEIDRGPQIKDDAFSDRTDILSSGVIYLSKAHSQTWFGTTQWSLVCSQLICPSLSLSYRHHRSTTTRMSWRWLLYVVSAYCVGYEKSSSLSGLRRESLLRACFASARHFLQLACAVKALCRHPVLSDWTLARDDYLSLIHLRAHRKLLCD